MIMKYFFSLNRRRGGNYPGLFEFGKIPRTTSKLSEIPGNFWKFSALARNFPEHDFQNFAGLKKFQNVSQNTSRFRGGPSFLFSSQACPVVNIFYFLVKCPTMYQFMYVASTHCLPLIGFAKCSKCVCVMYFLAVNKVVGVFKLYFKVKYQFKVN